MFDCFWNVPVKISFIIELNMCYSWQICINMHTYICIYFMDIYIYIHIYVHIYIYAYIYIYNKYIYAFTTCVYIYIYT